MDLQRAKIFLDKINREFSNMTKDPENISTIDVDILRQYVRDFYDAVLTEKHAVVAHVPAQKTNVVEVTSPRTTRPIGFNPERPKPEPKPEVQPVFQAAETTQLVDNEPVTPVFEQPAPFAAKIAKPEIQPVLPPQPEPIYQPTIEKIQSPKPPTQPVFASETNDATLALFEFKAAKELSEKLSEMPITDLRKALSLNDRLLMMRELFGADAPELDKTLTTLNALGSFDEAKSYLISFCADRFEWASKGKSEHARAFIKLVRRRFK